MKLLVVHPFKRRRDPEASAWLQALQSAEGFLDRNRGETRRGSVVRAQVEAKAWPAIAADDPTLSGRILAGVAATDRVRETLSAIDFTHLLLVATRAEHLAAAAMAFARAPLLEAVVVVDCTLDTVRALSTSFGQQLWRRFEGAARAGGAKLVILSTSGREGAALLSAASLPIARSPLVLPRAADGEGAPLVLVEDAEPEDGPERSAPRRLQAARQRFLAFDGQEVQAASAPDLWLQYLDSLGEVRNGLWVKQIELGDDRILLTEWRPA